MSSKITTEKFDVIRFEKIKHHLETQAEKDKARYFEIFVDNLKVVEKTNDVGAFDDYLIYIDEKTKIIKILLYSSCETSPRNDKFIFSCESNDNKNTLGELDVQQKITTAITNERERIKTEQLEIEVKELTIELEEAQEYIDNLEIKYQAAVTHNVEKSKEVKLGAVAALAIEHVLKRNPNMLSKIPLLGMLSGLDDSPNPQTIPLQSNESKTTFTSVVSEESGLEYELMRVFDDAQFKQVIEILNLLGVHKNQITTILELLKTEK
jgi:hypothetical protein